MRVGKLTISDVVALQMKAELKTSILSNEFDFLVRVYDECEMRGVVKLHGKTDKVSRVLAGMERSTRFRVIPYRGLRMFLLNETT